MCLQLHENFEASYTIHACTIHTETLFFTVKTHPEINLRVDVLADAHETVGVFEEHFLQRNHHTLKVRRTLLDVVADLNITK